MKNIKVAIYGSTLFLLLFAVSTQLEDLFTFTLFLFSLSPIVMVALVIHVLKHGIPSGKTWNEGYMYDDKEREEGIRNF